MTPENAIPPESEKRTLDSNVVHAVAKWILVQSRDPLTSIDQLATTTHISRDNQPAIAIHTIQTELANARAFLSSMRISENAEAYRLQPTGEQWNLRLTPSQLHQKSELELQEGEFDLSEHETIPLFVSIAHNLNNKFGAIQSSAEELITYGESDEEKTAGQKLYDNTSAMNQVMRTFREPYQATITVDAEKNVTITAIPKPPQEAPK